MLHFSKYHGLGNDFLVADLRDHPDADLAQKPEIVRMLCDRHFGVGGDGLLPILPATSPGADGTMRVLNADGSEAEMCGNGIRCVVKHMYERIDGFAKPTITLDTGAGPLTCSVTLGEKSRVETVTVDMGRPRLERHEIPMSGPGAERCISQLLDLGALQPEITAVSMGNPHAMIFVEESGAALRSLAETHGPALETHTVFPNRTNAEFVKIHDSQTIELVVWERGVGITLACGTGACATAVAACLNGHSQPGQEITVNLLGGPLAITVAQDYSTVLMRGPARHVYDAEIDLSLL